MVTEEARVGHTDCRVGDYVAVLQSAVGCLYADMLHKQAYDPNDMAVIERFVDTAERAHELDGLVEYYRELYPDTSLPFLGKLVGLSFAKPGGPELWAVRTVLVLLNDLLKKAYFSDGLPPPTLEIDTYEDERLEAADLWDGFKPRVLSKVREWVFFWNAYRCIESLRAEDQHSLTMIVGSAHVEGLRQLFAAHAGSIRVHVDDRLLG